MNLGKKIKVLRCKAGLTQGCLAKELNVSSQTISKWENDVCTPDISLLPELAAVFGVTIDELFDLSIDQKLKNIENMLEYEEEISDQTFRNIESFLLEIKVEYDENHKEVPKGKIYSHLARLYHHRMESDSKKVSEYAKKRMRLNPEDISKEHWLLQLSEGAAPCDWNIRSHYKTISFFKELVKENPAISRNYLELMDNLLIDGRSKEAKAYLDIYKTLEGHQERQVPIYEARIALKEHRVEEADSILKQLEETYPDDSGVLFELGGFYADACRYDEAIEYFERSFAAIKEGEPKYNDAFQAQAIIYEIQEKYEDAINALNRMIQNTKEFWGFEDGAPVQQYEAEKQRIFHMMK